LPLPALGPRPLDGGGLRLVATHLFKSPRYEIVFRRVSPGVLLDLPRLRVEAAEACHHTAEEAYAYRLSAGVDVLFSGDTAPRCEPLRRLGAGADVAVYEATCNEENGEVCRKYGHSTTLDAVAEGEAMGVKGLVLTHIDERFNPTIYQDVKKMGRKVVVAEDNMVVRL
jgi:ribonuclease Z